MRGIPLTHRDWASAATFVTGPRRLTLSIGRNSVASRTLVIFMGAGRPLRKIARRLTEKRSLARKPRPPLFAGGTRGDQDRRRGNHRIPPRRDRNEWKTQASGIDHRRRRSFLSARSSIGFERLAALRDKHRRPPGHAGQAGPFFVKPCEHSGAEVIELPTIETEPLPAGGSAG